MTPDEQPARWLNAHLIRSLERLQRRRYLLEAAGALVFLALGCIFGGARYGRLVLHGAGATGTIVGYETAQFRTRSQDTSSTHTGYMPLVEFETAGRTIRFRNWWGRRVSPQKGETVRVLYDPADPSVAMIDQGIRNWVPWAPLFALATFLALVALRTWITPRKA